MIVEPATRVRVRLKLMVVLCSIFFGVSITEATSVYVLPLTLQLFTDNPQYIFLILAINPAFGVIAQPIVGLWSDRVWTRWGRRAVFLITCAPVVAISGVLIPFAGTLLQIVLLVIVLQCFQDLLNGSDQPLIADMVPPEQRTFMIGLVKTFENLGFMLVLYVGMTLVSGYKETHGDLRFGLPMYCLAAACQIAFVMLPAFFIGEQPRERPSAARLTPARYIRDFVVQPMLLRIASAYFLRAFTRTAVVGSVALYATQTLAFSEAELGRSWGLMPFISLAFGVPLGLAAERFAKHRVLQLAFLAIIMACIVGYFSSTVVALAVAALIFGFGDMLLEVTHKAFMSDRYPSAMIGQLTGAVNIFYATGRTAALIFVGFCVKWANPTVNWDDPSGAAVDYRVIWIVSAISAVIGIALLNSVRDFRHEAKGPKGA